jgi:hypothetical protein
MLVYTMMILLCALDLKSKSFGQSTVHLAPYANSQDFQLPSSCLGWGVNTRQAPTVKAKPVHEPSGVLSDWQLSGDHKHLPCDLCHVVCCLQETAS